MITKNLLDPVFKIINDQKENNNFGKEIDEELNNYLERTLEKKFGIWKIMLYYRFIDI